MLLSRYGRVVSEMEPKYKRVLLKLSGESLAGEEKHGIDFDTVLKFCEPIKKLNDMGYSVDKKNIIIDSALSSLGTHIISIALHKKVIAKVKINLVK